MSYSKGQMQGSGRNTVRVYALIFTAWTVVGIFFFTQGLVQRAALNDPTPWWHYLLSWLSGVYLCAAFTPLILWAGRHYPLVRRCWIRSVPIHVLFAAAFSVSELAIHSFVLTSFGLFPYLMKSVSIAFVTLLFMSFHQNVMVYFTVLGIQSAFRYYGQYQESERQALRLELHASELRTQLSSAHLSALKMQLQPHFLFNTLNAIVVLVRQERTREAEEMLGRLSDLLRYVLEDVDAQEVSLRRELEHIRLYLDIERVRFQDRLRVEIATDPDTLDAAVPQLGLQPIVENAVQHGLGRSLSAGLIRISAQRSDGWLVIKVCDDGPGLHPDNGSGRGIGLSNTRARLRQLYGAGATVTLQDASPRGAVATMRIPYRLMSDLQDAEVIGYATDYIDSGR